MIGDRFDARTFANMNVALERVCQRRPDGEDHRVRKLVARRIIQCAKIGKKTLGALTNAGEGLVRNSRISAGSSKEGLDYRNQNQD
jgi:hypothetical protein